jgi:hypothetical protein
MIDITNIRVDDIFHEIVGRGRFGVDVELKKFIDAAGKEVERKAKEFAPAGPTGRLKAEGVVRHEGVTDIVSGNVGDRFQPGAVVTDLPSFGGGFTVRGPSGRFVSATKVLSPGFVYGSTFSRANYSVAIELNPGVAHSKWVHNGTGLYGPHKTPIVPRRAPFLVFHYRGRKWIKRSVRGQRPQPFLDQAFHYVNDVYIPARITSLKAAIAARQ